MTSPSPTPQDSTGRRPRALPKGYDPTRVRKALPFYRIMAIIVGFGLLLLVLEMVLKYGFGNDILAWWAMPHGFLYMVYLGASVNLGMPARWSLLKLIGVMLAGCVPFFSFWVEHRVSIREHANLAVAEQGSMPLLR